MEKTEKSGVTCLVPWFGGNRTLAHIVGKELEGRPWVGVLFAGGMAEVKEIKANAILVNDCHRHVINLARVIASTDARHAMLQRVKRIPFHPDALEEAQAWCRDNEPRGTLDIFAAINYFVCCWYGRSGNAGTEGEYKGGTAVRWNANGGSSVVRVRSAIRSMGEFSRIAVRCQFETMDAIAEFLPRCEDTNKHAVYGDPPFPLLGRKYRHNAGKTEAAEREWHMRLRDAVSRFERTRVVMRFYDHPLIRELYPSDRWTWLQMKGRNQANAETPEVLLINGPSAVSGEELF